MRTAPKAVYLEWIDHCSNGDGVWIDIKDMKIDVTTCKSVGFILKETEDWIVIAGHLSNDCTEGQCSGDMQILKKCILKRVPLSVPQ